jgi:hypothetical protein
MNKEEKMNPVSIPIGIITTIIPRIIDLIKEITSTESDYYSWDELINWFKNQKALKNADKDHIAFSLLEKSNKYKLIIGIFNKRTGEFPDVIQIFCKELDSKILNAHQNNELVVYE